MPEKILFIGLGAVQYTNQLLNKINRLADIEVHSVIPLQGKGHLGDGIEQDFFNIEFKIHRLKDEKIQYSKRRFLNIEHLIEDISPNIIVVTVEYVYSLLNNKIAIRYIKKNNIKIILKSIPFNLERYDFRYNEVIEFIRKYHVELKWIKFNILKRGIRFLRLDILYKNFFLKRKKLRDILQDKYIFNKVDAHVCYIKKAYEIYGSYGVDKKNIFITYNSPDTDYLFKLKEQILNSDLIKKNNNFKRIIHVGRLVKWKKVDLLIRSFYELLKDFSNIELLIIGDGSEKNNLQNLVKSLGISEYITFKGAIYDYERLAVELLGADIYVLAGMGGLSINDAMIFGLPVICHICDGTEEELVFDNYNGFYFDGSLEDLSQKISILLSDYKLRKKFGENSVKIIRSKINIHTVLNGYRDAFSYVLKKK